MGVYHVLGVHLKVNWANGDGPRHWFDVIGQCFAIAQDMLSERWKQAASMVIEPDVKAYKYDAFEHSAALVRAGEAAARAALPEIRKWLQTEVPEKVNLAQPRVTQPAVMPAD